MHSFCSICAKHREASFVILCSVISLLLRLLMLHYKDGVGTDEVLYLLVGYNLWHGKGFSLLGYPMTMVHPLLPCIAGFFSLFTHHLEVGTNVVYVVFGALTVLPYYLLVRDTCGSNVARIATFMLATYPPLLLSFYWGSMTEPLHTFWIVLSMYLFHKAIETERDSLFGLAGIASAFLYLSRSEGFLFFLVFGLYLVTSNAIQKRLCTRASLTHITIYTMCFLVVAMPYPLFLKKHTGSLSISGKVKLILLAGAMDSATRERYVGKLTEDGESFFNYEDLVKDKSVLEMIVEHPKVLVGGSFLQLKQFVVTLISWKVYPFFLLPFLLLGLFDAPWDRRRLKTEVFLWASCTPFLVFLSFLIWPRYLLPLTPILLVWTARGVRAFVDWTHTSTLTIGARPTTAKKLSITLPILLVALPLLGILIAKPVKARLLVQYPVEYKTAGQWMDAHLPPKALILARKPEVAYYARRFMHPLPNEDLERIIRYARLHAIEYLVVDDFSIATRPQLSFLLEQEDPSSELTLLYEGRSNNGRRIRVFQIHL